MKLIPIVLLVLFSVSAQAQDMPSKPTSEWNGDPRAQYYLGPLVREHISPETPIPSGMVWWKTGPIWYGRQGLRPGNSLLFAPEDLKYASIWFARDEGSCAECAKPMTFRQAAFDKKAIAMMGLVVGLQVGDALAIRRCDNQGYCREGYAPFFGDGSFKKQMAIKMPIAAVTWLATAYIRKGDKSRHIGGNKNWWQIPVVSDAIATVAIIANFKHQHSL